MSYNCEIAFVQIQAVATQGGIVLFGLTKGGVVWRKYRDDPWEEMPMRGVHA